MLQAGVGAPLLKLWVLAALDPAATAKGDLGEGDLGVSGIGRARASDARGAATSDVVGDFAAADFDDAFGRRRRRSERLREVGRRPRGRVVRAAARGPRGLGPRRAEGVFRVRRPARGDRGGHRG